MKRFFKYFGIFIFVVITLLILIPIIFKGKILKIVKEQANSSLNAKVDFTDFNLSVFRSFPRLSVELSKFSVVGVNEFEGDTLMAFNTFYFDVNLWSAIAGDQIEINSVELINPKIMAKILKDGKANWDITKDTTKAKADTTKKEASKFNIKLKRVEIKNGNIIFQDDQSGMNASIKNLNFKMKGDLTQDLTVLNINTSIDSITFLFSGIKYLKKAKIEYIADMEADTKNMKFTFKDNKFRLNELELGFEGWLEKGKTDMSMDLKFNSKKAEFKSVLSLIPAVYMTNFQDIKTSGSFSLKGYAKGIYNDKNLPAFGIELLVDNANFSYPALPKSVDNINVHLIVDNEGGTGFNNKIELKKGHIDIAQNPIDAYLFVQTSKEDVAMNGSVTGKLDFKTILDVMPLKDITMKGLVTANLNFAGNLSSIEKGKYEDFKFSGKAELNDFLFKTKDMPAFAISQSALLFNSKFIELQKFEATLGKSDMQVNGKIDNLLQYFFRGHLLAANFTLNSKLFDLNEFMSGDESKQATITTDTTALEAPQIPKNIYFKLTSRIAKVYLMKMEIDDMNGIITIGDGKAALDKVRMNALKGTMLVSGSYDSKDIQSPKAEFSFDVTNIDIQTAFNTFNPIQRIAPIAKNATGVVSSKMTMNLTMDKHLNPLMNTLNSEGNFKSANISIGDSKIFTTIADLTKLDKFRRPSLNNVDISYIIKDGVITIKPTKFNLAGSETTFDGTQNLNQTINYNLGVNLPQQTATQILNKLPIKNAPQNVAVTMVIGGTLSDPKIAKLRSSLFDNVKDEVDNKINEVKKDTKEKAKKILDEANQKAQQIMAEAEKKTQEIRNAAKIAADKIISEADAQGKKLISEAGSNPLKKVAAEKAAKVINEQAKKKADNLIQESENQISNIMNIAKSQADKITKEAQDKANAL